MVLQFRVIGFLVVQKPVEPGDQNRPPPALLQFLADVGGFAVGEALPTGNQQVGSAAAPGSAEVLHHH
jgi:hypothetical protein